MGRRSGRGERDEERNDHQARLAVMSCRIYESVPIWKEREFRRREKARGLGAFKNREEASIRAGPRRGAVIAASRSAGDAATGVGGYAANQSGVERRAGATARRTACLHAEPPAARRRRPPRRRRRSIRSVGARR